MPSRSRSRGRKKADPEARSVSRSRKKNDKQNEKPSSVPGIDTKGSGPGDPEITAYPRSRLRGRKNKEEPPNIFAKKSEDVAGNMVTVRDPPLIRDYMVEDQVIISQISTITDPKTVAKGRRKKAQHQNEPIQKRTRSLSMSVDRDIANDKGRGRKMERRASNTSLSPFCEKKRSPTVDMKANTLDEKTFTVVELVDISSFMKFGSGIESSRSVSLSRFTSALQSNVKESLVKRNARSLSRNRKKKAKESLSPMLDKSQNEKHQLVSSSRQSRGATKYTGRSLNKYTDPSYYRKSKEEIRTNNDKIELESSGNVSTDNESETESSKEHNMDTSTADIFEDESEDEIKTPMFVCRCCDDEFSSRFELHEHLVDFHRIKNSTAVLPPSPPPTDLSTPEERKSIVKRPQFERKSVSFGVEQSEESDVQDMVDSVLSNTGPSEHKKGAEPSIKKTQKKSTSFRAQKPKVSETHPISDSPPSIDASSYKVIESKKDSKPSMKKTQKKLISDGIPSDELLPDKVEKKKCTMTSTKKTRKRSVSNSGEESDTSDQHPSCELPPKIVDHKKTAETKMTKKKLISFIGQESDTDQHPSNELHPNVENMTIAKTKTKSTRKRSVSLSGSESDHSDQQVERNSVSFGGEQSEESKLQDMGGSVLSDIGPSEHKKGAEPSIKKPQKKSISFRAQKPKVSKTQLISDSSPSIDANSNKLIESKKDSKPSMKKTQKKLISDENPSDKLLPDNVENKKNIKTLAKKTRKRSISNSGQESDTSEHPSGELPPKIVEHKKTAKTETKKTKKRLISFSGQELATDQHSSNDLQPNVENKTTKTETRSTRKRSLSLSGSESDHSDQQPVNNLPPSNKMVVSKVFEMKKDADHDTKRKSVGFNVQEFKDSEAPNLNDIHPNNVNKAGPSVKTSTKKKQRKTERSLIKQTKGSNVHLMDMHDKTVTDTAKLDEIGNLQPQVFDITTNVTQQKEDTKSSVNDENATNLFKDFNLKELSVSVQKCDVNKSKYIPKMYKSVPGKEKTVQKREHSLERKAILVKPTIEVSPYIEDLDKDNECCVSLKLGNDNSEAKTQDLSVGKDINHRKIDALEPKVSEISQSWKSKSAVSCSKISGDTNVTLKVLAEDGRDSNILTNHENDLDLTEKATSSPQFKGKRRSGNSKQSVGNSKQPVDEQNMSDLNTNSMPISEKEFVAVLYSCDKNLPGTNINSVSNHVDTESQISTRMIKENENSYCAQTVIAGTIQEHAAEGNIMNKDINDNEENYLTDELKENLGVAKQNNSISSARSETTKSYQSEICEKRSQIFVDNSDITTDNKSEIDRPNNLDITYPNKDMEIDFTADDAVLKDFMEQEQIRLDVSQEEPLDSSLNVDIDSIALVTELDKGYNENAGLQTIYDLVYKKYKTKHVTNLTAYSKNTIGCNVSDKAVSAVNSFVKSGLKDKELMVRTDKNNLIESQENILENKSDNNNLSCVGQENVTDCKKDLNNIPVVTGSKEKSLFQLSKEKSKSDGLTPRPEKLHKKAVKNSKSEYTAAEKLDLSSLDQQSQSSEIPVNADPNTEVSESENSSKYADAKNKEIASTETVITNVDASRNISAEILETTDLVIKDFQSENICHEAVSCNEIVEIAPCSETEEICNEKSDTTSPSEIKTQHSIKIKLKRKRTWLQSVGSATAAKQLAEPSLDVIHTDTLHDGSEDKFNSKPLSKQKYSEINGKIPVIKLKKIPFTKIEINGLRLKFKGTKLKPYWKIRSKQSEASHEVHNSSDVNVREKIDQSNHNMLKEWKIHDKDVSVRETSKTANIETKESKSHENVEIEKRADVIREVSSKASCDKETLPNDDIISDNHGQNNSTIDSDPNSNVCHEPKCHQNIDKINVEIKNKETEQKVKETTEVGKKDRLKNKKTKDSKKNDRGRDDLKLKVKILGKKEKLNKELQLTEFDNFMLNSGKLRKENLKQAKRSNSIVRRKSDDSESTLESNRDILFGKSDKRKPVREDNVSLLSKSKIAQSILNRTEKERKSNEEDIPDFPPITDLESLPLPPLSASKTSATNSVSKSPSKLSQNKGSDDNTDSLEIISAEASGIMTSDLSLFSDTQVREAVDWFSSKQKQKEGAVKAPEITTSVLTKSNTDIEMEKVPAKSFPVVTKNKSLTEETRKPTPNTTSLSQVAEKLNESIISLKSKKLRKETVSNTATPRGKLKLKRLETNPVKHNLNDQSFQSPSEQALETSEKVPLSKMTEGKNRLQTAKDANVSLSGNDMCENELNRTISETMDTKEPDNVVIKTQMPKITCDNETSNTWFTPDYQDTVEPSVEDKNDSIENDTSRLASETLASLSSTTFVTVDETGFQTDITEDLLSHGLNKTDINTGTEDTFMSGKEQDMLDNETTVINESENNDVINESENNGMVNELKNNGMINELENNGMINESKNNGAINESGNNSMINELENNNVDIIEKDEEEAVEVADGTAEETAEGTDVDTTDASDSERDLSGETENDEMEEKVDVLSLYASDEDASFLEDDIEDDCIVRMGAYEKKGPDAPESKASTSVEDDNQTSSSSKSEASESVDMDIESQSSPSYTADTAIEVNRARPTPLQKQMMRDMVPPGYCFHFHTSGKCKNGISCRFKHDQPPKENLLKHWRIKMEQYLRQGEIDRSLMLFEQVTAEDTVPPQLVMRMFAQCRQAGNVKCFCLIKYMFDNQFLTVNVINQYIYMCGNNPSECVNYLWDVAQRMVSLNIQPANDAMYILLRAFSDSEAWEWLWQVMLYCNEMENFNMPIFCQEKALRAMLKEPGRYFNYAVQFLLNSDFERLQRLDKQLLQEVNNLSQKSGQTKLSQGMKTVLTSPMTPRPRTPVTPFIDGVREEEEYYEDEETVREWMNKFHGLQYSRNWDYLAELYLKRSNICCPIPDIYINKIVDILKKNEKAVEIFAEFLTCTFKRFAIESAENETVKIDKKGLAVIGNSLLILFAEKQNWQAGYQIICHMVSFNIEYLKYCGAKHEIAVVAMETCLQCLQPDSALQILKETTVTRLETSMFSFIRGLFPSLFQQLFSKLKFYDCVYVLSRAFGVVFKEPTQKDIGVVTSMQKYTCQLLKECLAQGDVPVGVKIFQLWMEYKGPFVLDVLVSRSLLVACYNMQYEEVTRSVFEMMKRRNAYPPQRISKPRNVILPMWMTSQEMFLVVDDYLKWLYNDLCNNLLENVRLTHADLQLGIRFTEQLAPTDEEVPFLHSVAGSLAHVQKMAADVLSQLGPGISSIIQTNGTILLEPLSLERWLCETDKKSRRQGLRFLLINGPTGTRGRGFPRPPRHQIPR